MSTVLLVGILLTGYGYFEGPATMLYAGLLVTVAGLIYGVLQLIGQAKS